MVNDHRARLLDLLARDALRFGDFTLTSGRKSDHYLNCKKVTRSPEGKYLIGHVVYEMARAIDPDADGIGGMTMGADPICDAVSFVSWLRERPMETLIVRKAVKEHGAQELIEGNAERVRRLIVVDDVVTTGGSTLRAMEAFRGLAQTTMTGTIALVDRQEGGAGALEAQGIPFRPVFTKAEVIARARALGLDTRQA